MIKKETKIYHTLRVASAMCFIGHGAFGIITKQVWCNYLSVIGIGKDLAYRLMPIIGAMDILMGLILLVFPVGAVALWLVIWGAVTATMRPLSGEPFAELLERAGNFGAPLSLLLLCPPGRGFYAWLKKLRPPDASSEKYLNRTVFCLRLTAVILLIGHGLLNLIAKKALLVQYSSLGFSDAHFVSFLAGIVEIGGAIAIAVRPQRLVVLFFLLWKIGTELFYPTWAAFEWIERGGSYGVLLALWFALEQTKDDN